jgi:hypothetical protein
VARRRKREELSVSLLPFLSVLACVMGSLILLVAAMALGSMGGASLDDVRRAQRMEQVEEELEAARARLQALERSVHEAEVREEQDGELRERLVGLGLSPDIAIEELQGIIRLREQLEDLITAIGAAEADAETALKLMEEAETKIDAAEKVAIGAPIVIDPSGIGREQRPYLVECSEGFLAIHRTQGDFSFRIPAEEIINSRDYKRFLKQVRAIRNGIVIFLIRPDGVSSYQDATRVAKLLGVRNAKLPLPGQGKLDFGRF